MSINKQQYANTALYQNLILYKMIEQMFPTPKEVTTDIYVATLNTKASYAKILFIFKSPDVPGENHTLTILQKMDEICEEKGIKENVPPRIYKWTFFNN